MRTSTWPSSQALPALAGRGAPGSIAAGGGKSTPRRSRSLDLAPAAHRNRATLLEQWARAACTAMWPNWRSRRPSLEKQSASDPAAPGEALPAGRALTGHRRRCSALGDPRPEGDERRRLCRLQQEPPGPDSSRRDAEQTGVLMIDGDFAESYPERWKPPLESPRLASLSPRARPRLRSCSALVTLGDPHAVRTCAGRSSSPIDQGKSRGAAIDLRKPGARPQQLPRSRAGAPLAAGEGVEFCRRRGSPRSRSRCPANA